jgi:hypothetical protein
MVGLTVHLLTARGRGEARDVTRALVAASAAMAPDLDLLLKLVDGRNHHQAESHSIGMAAAAALLALAFCAWRRIPDAGRWAWLVGLAWASHFTLDYFGRDTHPPIGLPALWPFTWAYLKFPWPVFLDIGRTLDWTTVRNNAVALAWEVVLLLPLLFLAGRRRLRTAA